MSTLTPSDVEKIAHLARLNMPTEAIAFYTPQLSTILELVEQMNQVNTTDIEPLAHSYDLAQRLRVDAITEPNQRDACQKIAPSVEAGLYLVPQVIEGE